MDTEEFNFGFDDCLNSNDKSKEIEATLSVHDVEAEKKCEFIQLNDESGVMKLSISEGFTSQWEQLNGLSTSSNLPVTTTDEVTNTAVPIISNNDAFIISLLGDTGVGKSFLTNHLLPSAENTRPIVIDETKRRGSTTANITCYKSTSFFPALSNTNFLLLDYEGERGSCLPRVLQRLNNQWTDERGQQRREAVSKYFPKLAYTISNVIILLSRDDFSNYDYISRCYDLAERATEKLQHNPYKPVLIMIHNYASSFTLKSSKEVTQQFFQMHHREETGKLRDFYERIYCITLPYRVNDTMNSTEENSANLLFSKHVTELKRLLVYIQEEHKQYRTLPHISWLEITGHVVDIVSKDRTTMMHMILRQVLVKDPGDIEQNTVTSLFNILYAKKDLHTIKWFYFCCNFAMSLLARAIAIRFNRNMNYISDGNMKTMAVRDEARVCLEKLWIYLDEFRPCQALYMGQGYAKEKDHPIFCLQHKNTHHEHRTSEVVYGVPLLLTKLGKIPKLWRVHDVWNGEFVSDSHNEELVTKEMHEKFVKEIEIYMQKINNSSDALYTTLEHLLKQYDVNVNSQSQLVNYSGGCYFCLKNMKQQERMQMYRGSNSNLTFYNNNAICHDCEERRSVLLKEESIERLAPPMQDKEECAICFNAPQITLFEPCYHQRFCQACADMIYNKFKQCPLCREKITKVITPK